MNEQQRKAMELSLEALETLMIERGSVYEKAITALKEALAQPEQERCVGCEACIDTACGRDECPKGWPKAPQRTWVGLTDEELAEFSDAKLGSYDLCLEVEAELRSKNK